MTEHQDTILDPLVLQELREDLEDAFDGFVQKFLGNARESLAMMVTAAQRGESEAVGHQAHALKGTAGYLGAVKLCAQLEKLQQTAKDRDRDLMSGILAAASADFEVLETQLLESLGKN